MIDPVIKKVLELLAKKEMRRDELFGSIHEVENRMYLYCLLHNMKADGYIGQKIKSKKYYLADIGRDALAKDHLSTDLTLEDAYQEAVDFDLSKPLPPGKAVMVTPDGQIHELNIEITGPVPAAADIQQQIQRHILGPDMAAGPDRTEIRILDRRDEFRCALVSDGTLAFRRGGDSFECRPDDIVALQNYLDRSLPAWLRKLNRIYRSGPK
jgi:hypothetical protein